MTLFRQRITEDMQLAGYSARTQEGYVSAVRQLFAHFNCNPSQLTEEQLRQYFLYLATSRRCPAQRRRSPCAGSSSFQVADIDSGRMFLHVHGKGGKDRYVPLPDRTLDLLREFLENAPISGVAVSPYQPRFEARRGDRSLDRRQPAEGVQAHRRRRRYR